MSELLEKAIAQLRLEPEQVQDEAAAALLDFLSRDEGPYELTAEQEAEIERVLTGLRDGTERLATDDEVAAMWRRCGL